MSTKSIGLTVLFVLAAGLASLSAHAQEWKGKGELGWVLARGNTNTETINAKIDMTTESDPWKHLVGFSVLRSTNADAATGNREVVTGDRYELHGQSDYKLTSDSYALGSLRYDNDKFAPFNYQAVAAVGYGYRFCDTDIMKFAVEAGVGYRRAEDHVTDQTQGNAIFRGAVNYDYKFTGNSRVYDKFLVESGSDNTFLQNEIGLQVNMSERLALSVADQIRHNTNIDQKAEPALKKTDQLVTANLVFSF